MGEKTTRRRRTRVIVTVWVAMLVIVVWVWAVFGSLSEIAIGPGPLVRVSGFVTASPPMPSLARAIVFTAGTTASSLSPLQFAIDHLDANLSFEASASSGITPTPSVLSGASQSRLAAAIAAASLSHRRVTRLLGVVVRSIIPTSSLRQHLSIGDVIVSLDGESVATAADFVAQLAAHVEARTVVLGVVGPHPSSNFRITFVRVGVPSGGGNLGLVVGPATLYRLSFSETIRLPDTVDSAAGLAEGLATLTSTGVNSVRVCALGSLEPDGSVGLVSGLRQRVIAARVAGIRYVIVPQVQVGMVRGMTRGSMTVIGVRSLAQAMTALRSVVARQEQRSLVG
ncbi:MAG: PDZ domain-containing protein [Ferrimicrobium sp.]